MKKIIKACNDEDVSESQILVERAVREGGGHTEVGWDHSGHVTNTSDLPAQSSGGWTRGEDHFRRSHEVAYCIVIVH
jgi:hypothetical protein